MNGRDALWVLGVCLIGLAVILAVAAFGLLIAAIWSSGETGNDLFLTSMTCLAAAPFVGIGGAWLVGSAA